MLSFLNHSGYTINNLVRHHSIEDIAKHSLKTDINKVVYDGQVQNYHPVNKHYIKTVVDFAMHFNLMPALSQPGIVWRGCHSLEEEGLDGLVSTTTDYGMVKRFDRGTILKIHLPAGITVFNTKCYLSYCSDDESEVILPPCNYKVHRESIIDSAIDENKSGKSRLVEISVTPKNFLRNFALALQNPPEDYFAEHKYFHDKKEYYEGVTAFGQYMTGTIVSVISSGARKPLLQNYTGADELEYIGADEFLSGTHHPANTETNMEKWLNALASDSTVSGEYGETQLSPKEFYDFVTDSEDFDILQEYLKSDEHLKYFEGATDGFHDVNHIDNTTLYAYYIAEKLNLSPLAIRLVLEATRNHDIGRKVDPNHHGEAGARLYKRANEKILPFYESDLVATLIEAHSLSSREEVEELIGRLSLDDEDKHTLCTLAQIVRDADVLDHVIVGFHYGRFRPDRLEFAASRDDLIDVALRLNQMQGKTQKARVQTQPKSYSQTFESLPTAMQEALEAFIEENESLDEEQD